MASCHPGDVLGKGMAADKVVLSVGRGHAVRQGVVVSVARLPPPDVLVRYIIFEELREDIDCLQGVGACAIEHT